MHNFFSLLTSLSSQVCQMSFFELEMYRLLNFYLENVLYLTGFYIYLLGINDRTKTLICILMIELFFFHGKS